MLRNLAFLALIGLVVYTVIDIARSDDDERLGAPAILWVLLVVLVPLLGSVVWLAVSRSRRAARADSGAPAPRGRSVSNRRPGPVAPDDDPEFLWRLDQERRRRDPGQRETGQTDEGPSQP